ncbi:MAG: enoyl-CoA hydratase, partial [SAR324 cluster bacterium]|nr:enoyl-CoA hydratase [SAR324 cluster bacterium]
DQEVAELASSIMSKSWVAVATGKRMFYKQLELPLKSAYDYASGVMAGNMMADDVEEGVDAYMQKRTPVWKHQ